MRVFGTLDNTFEKVLIKHPLEHPSYLSVNNNFIIITDTGTKQIVIFNISLNKIEKVLDFNADTINPSCAIIYNGDIHCIDKKSKAIININKNTILFKTSYVELWALNNTTDNTLLFVAPKDGTIIEINHLGNIIFKYTNRERLIEPRAVIKVSKNTFLILDSSQHCVYFLKNNHLELLFGEEGVPGNDTKHLKKPWGFDLSNDILYICDSRNSRLIKFNLIEQKTETIDLLKTINKNGVEFVNYGLVRPMSIKFYNNKLYVVDSINQNLIQITQHNTEYLIGYKNNTFSIFKEPRSIDISNDLILIVDSANNRLIEYKIKNNRIINIFKSEFFSWLRCAKYINNNYIFIIQASVNSDYNKFFLLDKEKMLLYPIMNELSNLVSDPHSIDWDEDDNIIIADAEKNCIIIYNIVNKTHYYIGTNYLSNPHFAISFNKSIYICDTDNDRLVVYKKTENRYIFDKALSNISLLKPRCLSIENKNIIIADSGNSRIVAHNNKVIKEYAEFKRPQWIIRKNKRIYISDFSNNCIIEIEEKDLTNEKNNIY
ncbi:MAG: hypothetical protein NC213_03515 [Acetobacter sp.]|nr:hypothetical protein [Bacteroides sp.]MCM1340792.1 hypothetical protein [Acetobacter sp.]MCM1432651.1 hypothetical protein [Clostridiales bacterium]